MFPKTLLTTLLLALTVAANPVLVDRAPVSLSFSRRVNATSVQHLLKHDQARARLFKQKGSAKALNEDAVISSPVDNQAVSYIASVGVGSPATQCRFWTPLYPRLKANIWPPLKTTSSSTLVAPTPGLVPVLATSRPAPAPRPPTPWYESVV